MRFLNVIRYQNLLMLALMQLILRYGFLELRGVTLALSDWQYGFLVLSTVCIAAGGYLVNNIFDQDTDNENRPEKVIIGKTMTEAAAYNFYVALNVVGVGCGFYLANIIGKPAFALFFIIIAATLYLYATTFKRSLLIGNIIVALLLSVSVIVIGIFDLYPVITSENRAMMGVVFRVLLDYAVFAFIINLIREIVKDMEDINGDYNQGMNTLPIAIGAARTAQIVFWASFLPILLLLFYINTYFVANELWIATGYTLLTVVGPLIYFTIRMWNASKPAEFHHLATVLKFVMLFGILSALVISLNIIYRA